MFFQSWFGLLRVVLAGVTGYVAPVVVLRASGKRTLSKMNAFDPVVTVALGSCRGLAQLSTGGVNARTAQGLAGRCRQPPVPSPRHFPPAPRCRCRARCRPLPGPVPGFEQCPAAGSPCAVGLPPLLPCGINGRNAVVVCQSSATGLRTWKVEHIACPQPECVTDFPPPSSPGTEACPPAGSPCPGDLPPGLLCNVQGRNAFMVCQGPTGWKLEVVECL